ncbi:MAG: hypothetical protein U0W24_05770 [Bacteroidales bacterium]
MYSNWTICLPFADKTEGKADLSHLVMNPFLKNGEILVFKQFYIDIETKVLISVNFNEFLILKIENQYLHISFFSITFVAYSR